MSSTVTSSRITMYLLMWQVVNPTCQIPLCFTLQNPHKCSFPSTGCPSSISKKKSPHHSCIFFLNFQGMHARGRDRRQRRFVAPPFPPWTKTRPRPRRAHGRQSRALGRLACRVEVAALPFPTRGHHCSFPRAPVLSCSQCWWNPSSSGSGSTTPPARSGKRRPSESDRRAANTVGVTGATAACRWT
jgi:hypothetical protein